MKLAQMKTLRPWSAGSNCGNAFRMLGAGDGADQDGKDGLSLYLWGLNDISVV